MVLVHKKIEQHTSKYSGVNFDWDYLTPIPTMIVISVILLYVWIFQGGGGKIQTPTRL